MASMAFLRQLSRHWVKVSGSPRAMGASGALGLWNHQNPKLARWGTMGWSFVLGLPYLGLWLMA